MQNLRHSALLPLLPCFCGGHWSFPAFSRARVLVAMIWEVVLVAPCVQVVMVPQESALHGVAMPPANARVSAQVGKSVGVGHGRGVACPRGVWRWASHFCVGAPLEPMPLIRTTLLLGVHDGSACSTAALGSPQAPFGGPGPCSSCGSLAALHCGVAQRGQRFLCWGLAGPERGDRPGHGDLVAGGTVRCVVASRCQPQRRTDCRGRCSRRPLAEIAALSGVQSGRFVCGSVGGCFASRIPSGESNGFIGKAEFATASPPRCGFRGSCYVEMASMLKPTTWRIPTPTSRRFRVRTLGMESKIGEGAAEVKRSCIMARAKPSGGSVPVGAGAPLMRT